PWGTRPRGAHADVPRLPRARGDEARARGDGERSRGGARGEGDPGRLVVDGPHHARRPREAARRRVRATGAAGGVGPDALAAAGERAPLPVLRLDEDAAREHLRPDAVPFAPLLRELPPAVRAVQDDLEGRTTGS